MKVKLHHVGRVRLITNKQEEEMSLKEGAKLGDLLKKLAECYGKRFAEEVFDPVKGVIHPEFVTMINGTLSQSTETKLKDGDYVVLMPVMSGG